jgi:hypothetical protein
VIVIVGNMAGQAISERIDRRMGESEVIRDA